MAVYAIGDLQGCYDSLQKLLQKLKFSAKKDTLWFAGDLVNRGEQSLECLRFIKSLGSHAVCVLGNHDVNLLAIHYGLRRSNPTLQAILDASDREKLMDWLRFQPLLHHDKSLGWCMIHAGLAPQWTLATAKKCAQEVERLLQGNKTKEFLNKLFKNHPDRWSKKLSGIDQHRFTINSLTRIRYCHPDGRLDFYHKDFPNTSQNDLIPWFKFPDRRSKKYQLLFGHWSTLGYYQEQNLLALDTGCVWQAKLTAVRIDTKEQCITQVNCNR